MNHLIGKSYDAISVHQKLERINKAGDELVRLLKDMGTYEEKEKAISQWIQLTKQPINLPEGDTKKSWETWK